MKITTKIKWNIDTWEVLEEEFFEYDGPLALCYGDDPDEGDEPSEDPWGDDYDDLGVGGSEEDSFWSDVAKGGIAGFVSTGLNPLGAVAGAAGGALKSAVDSFDFSSLFSGGEYTGGNLGPEPDDNAGDGGVSKEVFSKVMRMVQKDPEGLAAATRNNFNPAEYLMMNPDVLDSSYGNSFKSAVQHYQQHGTPEGRKGTFSLAGLTTQEGIAASGIQGVEASALEKAITEGGTMADTTTPTTTPYGDKLETVLGKGTAQYQRDTEAFRGAMSEFEKVNTDISFLHDISELSGGLSDDEKAFLETMRSNATENLISTVNEATTELASAEIAKLVNKGVLQGNIGERVLSQVYEKSGKLVAEQSRNIESDVARMGLDISEQKKLNQLSLWNKEMEAAIKSSELGLEKGGKIGSLELGGMEAADRVGVTQTGMDQEWNQSVLQALTSMRGQDISSATALKTGQTQASTQLNIAGQEMSAWKKTTEMDMWGNVGSAIIDAWK